jgi:hypothetical protein
MVGPCENQSGLIGLTQQVMVADVRVALGYWLLFISFVSHSCQKGYGVRDDRTIALPSVTRKVQGRCILSAGVSRSRWC